MEFPFVGSLRLIIEETLLRFTQRVSILRTDFVSERVRLEFALTIDFHHGHHHVGHLAWFTDLVGIEEFGDSFSRTGDVARRTELQISRENSLCTSVVIDPDQFAPVLADKLNGKAPFFYLPVALLCRVPNPHVQSNLINIILEGESGWRRQHQGR